MNSFKSTVRVVLMSVMVRLEDEVQQCPVTRQRRETVRQVASLAQ